MKIQKKFIIMLFIFILSMQLNSYAINIYEADSKIKENSAAGASKKNSSFNSSAQNKASKVAAKKIKVSYKKNIVKINGNKSNYPGYIVNGHTYIHWTILKILKIQHKYYGNLRFNIKGRTVKAKTINGETYIRWLNIAPGELKPVHIKGGWNFIYTKKALKHKTCGKLYWAARDIKKSPIGNHHFLLILFKDKNSCQKVCKEFKLEYKIQKKGKETIYFITIGATSSNGSLISGLMKCTINDSTDIKAVRQRFNSNTNNSIVFNYNRDYDLEGHLIQPLSGLNDEIQIKSVIKAVLNYQAKKDSVPRFDIRYRNCTTWVNSLLCFLGYSKKYREQKSNFFGLEHAQGNLIPNSYFMD